MRINGTALLSYKRLKFAEFHDFWISITGSEKKIWNDLYYFFRYSEPIINFFKTAKHVTY